MPKRPPTPPSTDDSQFFTVVNPYPDQPYEALENSITFARWIACVIGQENLISFYHKPKSPNIVIIELCKDRVDLRRLLGEHRWSEMLRNPNKQEAAETSTIFPCKKNNAWSLEKIRWLRRDVETSWFKHWSPVDDVTITYPYPASSFCQPPAEDVTRERLCCPLPRELFSDSSAQVLVAPSITGRRTPAASSRSSALSTHDLPMPPGLPIPQFIPAIHGYDVPKANIVAPNAATQAPTDTTLWSGYGEETECKGQNELCTAHNVLCHRGICKWCAERKRAQVREERAKERQQEKEAWMRQRKRGHGRTQSQGSADTSTDASGSSRPGSPTGSSLSTPSAGGSRARKLQLREEFITRDRGKDAPVVGRAMPAHLRKGGSKADSTSSVSAASTSPDSSSTRVPTADDARSTVSSSYDSSSYKSDTDGSSPRSLHVPAPWAKPAAWQAHAKLPPDDASSIASGETRDAFRNPWKRVPPMQSVRPRWGDIVDGVPRKGPGPLPQAWSTSRREEDASSDASEFDTEPF